MQTDYNRRIAISRVSFVALLPSKIDQDFVEVVSTGEKLRINDLRNPISAVVLERGLRSGVYKRIERAYPRSFLERATNWRVNYIDSLSGTADVTIFAPSGERNLVCQLVVKKIES